MAIQLFAPQFEVEECLEEIRECLEKGWTGLGFKTVAFEEKWKEYTGLANAYFVNSATSGLNLAIDIMKEAFEWQDGDEIISTPLTFVSTNHAILLAGLTPVFADVDETLCLSPDSVKERITDKTKAVLYVGMGGNAGKWHEIVEICKEKNIKLILDAAHMAGTRVDGVIPGTEADAVIYSYQAVKNMPTGDSGMLCFKEKNLDVIARKKAWLGINKDTYSRFANEGTYKWKYDVEYVGQKYHGNSIMAAIALVQLKYLDRDNAYRRQIAEWYDECFDGMDDVIKRITVPENCESSRHLYQIIVENRDGLIEELRENEIYPGVHYICNTEYAMYESAKGTCEYAEYVSDHVLSLPMHLRLTKEDVQKIADVVIKYVK